MPLSRHKVANEYSLGGRDLYKRADQKDPEAVLDGVAMAGLVGVLRQLGDLAEFASQVFHGLYDEVMIASARGHGLMLRVQQLEAELPLMEKDSCQRDYLYVASNRGVDWHANPRVDHGVVTRGDTPRFIMESIKQCHGPPKLIMLDKYDIGGEGTCLKRYTDPSFFKTDSACSTMLQEGIQRERRPLRAMEIRPNVHNSEIFSPPNEANNDSEFDTDLSGEALNEVQTRRRRLKHRQLNGSVFRSFRPQLQNLYEKAVSEEKPSSMDQAEVQISFSDSPDSKTEERDIMIDTSSSMDKGKEDHCAMVRKNRSISEEALSRSSNARSAGSSKGYNSEVDIYVDALTTMDSEVETDSEHRDHGHRAFARVESNKVCSDTHSAVVSRSSSFNKKDSLVPYFSDVGSENGDKADHHQEDVTVSIPQAKSVAGEHERTSSLEELFGQEKPVSCEHERTKSLEELLTGDAHASEPDVRASATESNTNGIVSNATTDGTVDSTKKAKENPNIATISFKKITSKRSKYVGSMELLASKVGILPRILSKKHDPFSDSLRNMAKELLELKYDGTQDTDLYDFEANGEGCNVKCPEIYHPHVEIKESVIHSIPSDSPQDDVVGSRECQSEEVNQESDHDVPPTDSPQDSVPDGNGFQHTNIVYLTNITSSGPREEEGCAGAATDEHSSTGMLDHTSELIHEKIEDIHTEVVSENASDMGVELKEVSICEEQVNAKDAEECSESDEYAVDDESTEYIEEQVVSDGVISPTSSKLSDDPCRITPLTLTDADADDAVASKGADNHIPEMKHITLLETITETYLPKVVTESVITSEAAVPDNEQCYLHPETSFSQDIILSSCEVVGQNEQLRLRSSSMMVDTPDITVNTVEIHESHQPVHQEPPSSCNSSSTEIFGDPLAPDSRDVPLPNISSFDWMLNGAMQQSLNVLPAQPTYGVLQENGSSEDTEHTPPLPPLPPMQWRTAKLQTGSTALFAKLGRPPRPKSPVEHQEIESISSLDERNQEAEMLLERSLHNGFTSQKKMAQATVSNEIQTYPFLNRDSQENHLQDGYEECDVQASNLFSASEVKTAADVASVEGDNLHTLQLPELMVIPEEAWSELVDIKPIPEQEKEQKHKLSNGVSDCNGIHATGLPTEKTNEECERSYQKEKECSAADSNTIADSEENKPSGVTSQDDMQNPDLSVYREDVERGSSDDKAMEFSSALEEELAKLPPNPVPKASTYPLLQVTSHDRSILRKAPTLVQPSSKLSDEKNTMLEQIKNKSFNLKPVLTKRPNVMGGPRTNLQVVAILERANAIRQAVADDDDSWSE